MEPSGSLTMLLQVRESMAQKFPKSSVSRNRSADTMVRIVRTYLGLPRARAGADEPPPPAASGTFSREVDLRDGSVKWVKSVHKVN